MEILAFQRAAARYPDRIAIVADRAYRFDELLVRAETIATHLVRSRENLGGARVAYLLPPGFEHVAVQWAIWLAGGVAVPLALSYPATELNYVIGDSGSSTVIADPSLSERLEHGAAGCELILTTELPASRSGSFSPVNSAPTDPALMIYTSGTTGKPKGVLTTHANINAQVASLHEAWGWTAEDRVLLVLPLHHVHGIVNVVCSSLWAGACCEMTDGFDARDTWDRLASGEITLFMAVPTVYRKLINVWEQVDEPTQVRWAEGASTLRVMISGSAALPVSVHKKWAGITGHTLLERYGMTEIGMALSNPLHGERRAGTVGQPLPKVDVKLRPYPEGDADSPAEILVRGPTVFTGYWGRPEDTAAAFEDGWFKTGDTGVLEEGYYRILGRNNIDIIKTGGFKISALEIEEVCRTHEAIDECAVVGVPDEVWGERVCIAIECVVDSEPTLEDIHAFTRDQLAPYKIPRDLRIVKTLPRNAMGKVTKPEVKKLFETKETEPT